MGEESGKKLQQLIAAAKWADALALASSLSISTSHVEKHHYLALTHPTPTEVTDLLSSIAAHDPEWVTRAALQTARSSDVAAVVQAAVHQGLAATSTALAALLPDGVEDAAADSQEQNVKQLVAFRRTFLELHDRVSTWSHIWSSQTPSQTPTKSPIPNGEDEEDPWGVEEGQSIVEYRDEDDDQRDEPEAAIPLQTFLRQPLEDSALDLAASAEIEPLSTVISHHAETLSPHRFAILDAIPEWTDPLLYRSLLPGISDNGSETLWQSTPWRSTPDWTQLPSPTAPLSSPQDLSAYYTARVEGLASLGFISNALSLVQHCASLGVPGLDALGEELSLLAKLVYERPYPSSGSSHSPSSNDVAFTLEHWRSLSDSDIVQAYTLHSTPASIASDLRRLVFPYLSVLESRLERSGTPDPLFTERLFHSYLFHLAASPLPRQDLPLLVAIFEASIPTLPRQHRLIKSDEELARLALSCLYGCRATDSDSLLLLGKIFECLPALDSASPLPEGSTPLLDLPADSLDPSTIYTLGVSTLRGHALAAALDTLDLHLTTAEIFSRYSAPVRVSWFLTSHSSIAEQRAWATRLARTSASGGEEGGAFESDDEWEGLLEDLLSLTDEGEPKSLKKAFWLVERGELIRIFFGGLLAAGKFGLAKSMFRPSSTKAPLDSKTEEELVIAASREFYDNAETGNLHKGNMKLAFDCLNAAPQTVEIKKERDFIEATSRLCSFKIYSQPGVPITPIEIRLSKDRLSFVSRLLSSNDDAYQYPDMLLDLVAKLGYRSDPLAEIRTLAMVADSALQATDYQRAADTADRIVTAVQAVQKKQGAAGAPEAADLAWQTCFQLGKHGEFTDLERRMALLGQALILCPGEQIATLLPFWSSLESQLASRGEARAPETKQAASVVQSVAPLGVDTAARTLNRAAAFFGGGVSPSESAAAPPSSSNRAYAAVRAGLHHGKETVRAGVQHSREEGREGGLRAGLSNKLASGVGWLIGADEGRMDERY